MIDLSNLHFIRPLWLLLLPIAVTVWWLHRKARDPLCGWRAAIEPDLLSELTLGQEEHDRFRGSWLVIGWVACVIAIAGPTGRVEPSPFSDDPVSVMILLKAGESMTQSDLAPSRMERARLKVADFATARPGQPLGLIAFAGSPHLVLPPTKDTSIVASMAYELTPEIMPKPGDDLVAALRLGEQTLGDRGGVIIVVDDRVPSDQSSALNEYRKSCALPIHFHAISGNATPELETIREAAAVLSASATVMTPDDADIDSLVRRAAKSGRLAATTGEGTRWAEAGWWLVPVIALISLFGFRRETDSPTEVTL